MPDGFVIKPFLLAHRSEVKGMLLTEYNEAATMELFREEGKKEGREEGKKEGFIHALIRMVRRGKITEEEAAQEANMTKSEFVAEMQKA